MIARQADLLFRSPIPLAANLLNAAVVCAVLWEVIDPVLLAAWWGLMATVILPRGLLWWRYRGGGASRRDALRRVWLYTAATGATGLLWGASASVVFLTDSFAHHVFVAFVTAGMGAGAIASNAAYRPAFLTYLVPATAPLSVAFFIKGGSVYGAMGLMVLVFLGLMSLIGLYFNRTLVSGLRLQAQNERLIGRLSRRRDDLERRIEARTAELREANALLEGQVAERRRAEEALRLSEDRLLQATRLAKLGYCLWDSIGDRCVYCSEEHARIHGLDAEQYVARSSSLDGDYSLTHPEDRDSYRSAIRRLRGEGIGFEMEYRVIRPDGAVRHVREVVKPLFDAEGTVVREFSTIQDVTDLKHAEEQLRQAMKMQALGQLAGGMAHDFNNLLGVILANLELMSPSMRDGDLNKPLLDRATGAVERGANLTRRLLAFTRQRPLDPRVLDINTTLSEMGSLLSRTLGEAIETQVSLAPDLWRVKIDPAELESALINLVLNARDAMPKGGRLIIETRNTSIAQSPPDSDGRVAPGDYVAISVGDDGIGIAPEHLDKVFEPFFTTKDVGQGSGLGLSMVYGFIERSGGQLAIDSTPGEGTTVRLYFPKSQAQDATSDSDPIGAPAPKGNGEKILLVEDDEDLRSTAATMLSQLGYDVVAAAEGGTALDLLRRTPAVDLLFTDVVLPNGMDGPTLAGEAKTLCPGLKVLFASGHTRNFHIEHDGGFDGAELLAKPYKRAPLAKALRRLIEGGRADT